MHKKVELIAKELGGREVGVGIEMKKRYVQMQKKLMSQLVQKQSFVRRFT
jgi:hypothetical protein